MKPVHASLITKDSMHFTQQCIDLQSLIEKTEGVPSGFCDLDLITGGFKPGELVVIAGRPSVGITDFARNIIEHVATGTGAKYLGSVLIFSLNTNKELFVFNLILSFAKLNPHSLKKDDQGRIVNTLQFQSGLELLNNANVFVDDTADISVQELCIKARELKAEQELGLIIIDDFQCMSSSSELESRFHELHEISRLLKSLAKELKVPIIVLSQLERRVEKRHDKKPKLSDLRKYGALEQYSDLILFITRDAAYCSTCHRRNFRDSEGHNNSVVVKDFADVIVAKNRQGAVGEAYLAFNPFDLTPMFVPVLT